MCICPGSFHPQDLILRGDVSSGAKEQFENEAKMAVRLANFISAFLQVSSSKGIISQRLHAKCRAKIDKPDTY